MDAGNGRGFVCSNYWILEVDPDAPALRTVNYPVYVPNAHAWRRRSIAYDAAGLLRVRPGDRVIGAHDGLHALCVRGSSLIASDTASGVARELAVLHEGPVRGVAWSPGGALVASCGDDHTVRIWQADDGRTVWLLEGHGDPVRAVAFAPDRPVLYSVSSRGVLKAWDLSRGVELASLDLPPEVVPVRSSGLRVAPNGDSLCVLWGDWLGVVHEVDLRTWSLGSGGSAGVLCEEARYTSAAALVMIHAPRTDRSYSWAVEKVGDDGASRNVGGVMGTRRPRVRVQTSLSPDCALLAHSNNRSFVVRAFPSGAVRASLTSMAFDGDLRHLTLGLRRVVASISRETLCAWNLPACTACLKLPWNSASRTAVGADATHWTMTLPGGDRVTSLALSPDESHVLVGTRRGALMCWRIP